MTPLSFSQHSVAHVIQLDAGAQNSRQESSLLISNVKLPQFCMLKGQQEIQVPSDYSVQTV